MKWLHPQGDEVFEIRILNPDKASSSHWQGRAFGASGKKPVVAGWFRDQAKAAALVGQIRAAGIYVTLNPCKKAILARVAERLKANTATSSDGDMASRRNLLFDFDPKRPAGISSTDNEHGAAILFAQQVKAELAAEGWPAPLVGDSGNGAHLVYALELEHNPENTALLRAVLGALAQRYAGRLQEAGLEVDQTVFNASRISKVYGTRTGKGDNLPERPHRYAKILDLPEIRTPVAREMLEGLVAAYPPSPQTTSSKGEGGRGPDVGAVVDLRLDVAAYLAHYGREVSKVKDDGHGGQLFCLSECIFDPAHSPNEAAVGQSADGKLYYQCFHNSCRQHTWTEARAVISGHDKLTPFMPGRPSRSRKQKAPSPGSSGPPAPITEKFNWSDLGNARRLVVAHGQDLRYSQLNKEWYDWDGKVWRVDNRGEVVRRAKATIDGLYDEVKKLDFESDARKNFSRFALKSEGASRIQGMLILAQSEPGIAILPGEFDSDPWLFNVQNGVIDLCTGELQPHRREDLLTCISSVAYDPLAQCPQFHEFMAQIFDHNQRMINFIWTSFGYALTGDVREQCFWMLWGSGANGKGTLMDCISHIFGSYWLNISTETLLAQQNNSSQIRSDVARLDGPRLVTAAEIDQGRRLSESLIKGLSGQNTITARFLYGKDFDFKPQFKLFIETNNKPIIKDQTNAMWRRLKLVEFPMDFRAHPDRGLPEKLLSEAPGILRWLINGCLSWQDFGDLAEPAEVIQAVQDYRDEMNPLKGFIDTCCVLGTDLTITSADLYKSYCDWAEENLQKGERLKKKGFGLTLAGQGFKPTRSGAARFWRGLGLRIIE
ncbi:MAG: DNA primase family protein [Candidatus Cryosericum sp.]